MITDYFNKTKIKSDSIIILKEEKLNILETLHKGLGHIGITRYFFKIAKKGFYWNKLFNDVKKYIKSCKTCTTSKLNKFKKPSHTQIISYTPLESVEMDIKYLNKIYPKNESNYKYFLYLVDHLRNLVKLIY